MHVQYFPSNFFNIVNLLILKQFPDLKIQFIYPYACRMSPDVINDFILMSCHLRLEIYIQIMVKPINILSIEWLTTLTLFYTYYNGKERRLLNLMLEMQT